LHTENQLFTLPGSALKVWVVGGGWVGVEGEFSDHFGLALAWPWPSRTTARKRRITLIIKWTVTRNTLSFILHS
jgi:hypothetical protein